MNPLFKNCISITDINMPNTVLEIKSGAFCACISLKEVHLSENLQEIPEATFRDCRSLEYISVPDKVRVIELDAFSRCDSLKELSFPPSLEILSYYALGNHCNSLELIKIPDHTKIMNTFEGEPSDLFIGRGTKIERFTCDSQHKCDSSPNVSEGEKPSPGSFEEEPLRAYHGRGEIVIDDQTMIRMLEAFRAGRSSPIPDNDNPSFGKTSKFKNPAVAELEETVREEQLCRFIRELSPATMAANLEALIRSSIPHASLAPNNLHDHGSEATDPYAFLDRYHFVLQKDLLGLPYLVKVIDKGEFHSKLINIYASDSLKAVFYICS